MFIGGRLRQLREAKGLSQSDLEDRSRLARSHTFPFENGHAAPTVNTLEKDGRAHEGPMCLFHNGAEPPEPPRFIPLAARMSETDRSIQRKETRVGYVPAA